MYGQVKKWPDEIRLKDGTLIIGEIVEHKPDKGYWILLPTGETKFYKNEDIESVRDKEDNTKDSNNPVIINNNIINNNNNNNNNNNVIVERRVHIDTLYVRKKIRPEHKGYLAIVGGGGSSLAPIKKIFGMIGLDFSYLVRQNIGASLLLSSTQQEPYSISSYVAGPMISFEIIPAIRVESKTMIGFGNIKFVEREKSSSTTQLNAIKEYLNTGVKFSYAINAQARLNLGHSWCFLLGYSLAGTGIFVKSEFFAGLGLRIF